MARGLRFWLAVVILGCAAVLGLTRVWTGAVRDTIRGGLTPDSATVAYTSLSQKAVPIASAIQRIRWSRAILERDPDSLILLGPNLPISAANRSTVRAARSLLRPGETVAIAIAEARWQRPDDGNRYLWYTESQGVDYLLPETGPCQAVAFVPGGPATPSTFDRMVRADNLLGPCFWVARYGRPSDSVLAWLRVAGGAIAGSATPSQATPSQATPSAARSAAPTGGRTLNRLEDACRRGDDRACETVIGPLGVSSTRRPPPPEMEGLLMYSRAWVDIPFDGVGGHILADIEAEIGPDRFAAFWHTDRPADVALSEALGRPVGEWLADWAVARFPEPVRAGPGVGDILLTLLTVAVLAGIGLLLGSRGRPITGL